MWSSVTLGPPSTVDRDIEAAAGLDGVDTYRMGARASESVGLSPSAGWGVPGPEDAD